MNLFQLTSSRRGWLLFCILRFKLWYFNSHPHEEDDFTLVCVYPSRSKFQLTSSRRGWRLGKATKLKWIAFQLTSSRRGWHMYNVDLHDVNIFQLTSSRRGWRSASHGCVRVHDISTHILTKRMTLVLTALLVRKNISTHILTKRMTINVKKLKRIVSFQLTSSRRGWLYASVVKKVRWYFNSHPHEEDDTVHN